MNRRALLIPLFFLAGDRLLAQSPATSAAGLPEIVNTGHGEVRLHPDRATLTVTVVTRAPTAAAAGRLNGDRIRPVLAALRRLSLPDSALATSGYSVQLEYQREVPGVKPEPRMYVATNSVRVKLTRLDDLGVVIDTALATGATGISDVSYGSSLAHSARQRAIGIAVREALADATSAAEAAGGRLGPVIEIDIDPNQSMPYAPRAMLMAAAVPGQTPMMPEDISVVVQARVRSVLLRAAP